jgi:hypothetical protein
LELFDIAPEPKPKKPTVQQMKFLHILSAGKLQFGGRPFVGFDLEAAGKTFTHRFPHRIAASVVMYGWAQMKSFNGSAAVYTLSTTGRELIKEFCAHKHLFDDTTEILGGKIVCKKCGCAVRCRSKQPTPHASTRWHWKYGPMCQPCWDYLYPKNP